jgi:hypothetical protein
MYTNTIINGETAIKPYYYMRNGVLHARYTVDRAVELSESEEKELKDKISLEPYNKQAIFSKYWNLLTVYVRKTIIHDGLQAGLEKMSEMTKKVQEDGFKN